MTITDMKRQIRGIGKRQLKEHYSLIEQVSEANKNGYISPNMRQGIKQHKKFFDLVIGYCRGEWR